MIAGILLLVYQLNGYFTDHTHHHPAQAVPQEPQNEQVIQSDTNDHKTKHKNSHSHGHDHPHSH